MGGVSALGDVCLEGVSTLRGVCPGGGGVCPGGGGLLRWGGVSAQGGVCLRGVHPPCGRNS